MQHGQSKDHRPDLPQLKVMAAAVAPSGHLVACDVVPGQRADDPLYTPVIARVRAILGQRGLLYAGDCKMAALTTRADIAVHQDYYLTPLPRTGETAQEWDQWIDAIVDGPQVATLIWAGDRLLGGGYEFARSQTASVAGQAHTWTERVQVVRSLALAQHQQAQLERRLIAATAAVHALTPTPGRGKRQIRDAATLHAAIDQVLERHGVSGLLTVTWERQETAVTRYQGRGRGSAHRPTVTQVQVRYAITGVQRDAAAIAARQYRLGWRVYVTNAPVAQLSLPQAVRHYRGGWVLERDFHLVKDLPLGLSPLFVWKDDQIKGLTRLLTLALRLLTLIETQVRQGLTTEQTTLAGLYEGQPHRTTARPTGKRLLKAFARTAITLTYVQTGPTCQRQITPLSTLHEQVLRYLRLPTSIYTALAYNTS